MDLLLNLELVNAVNKLRNLCRVYDSRNTLEESGCRLQDLWYSVHLTSTKQPSTGAKADDCESEVR